MSDTIELLEAIGQNASLRFAPTEEVLHALENAGASDELKTAVVTGERITLISELGPRPNQPPQIINAPGHEEDEPDENDEEPPMQLSHHRQRPQQDR